VFEFVKDPTCVLCADAKTQSGASYCAAQELGQADKDLNSTYETLLESFPKKQEQLKEAERAWIAFRDRFCAAFAGSYEGGSVEREVVGKCKVVETRHQILRLNELRKEWSSTSSSQLKAPPRQGGGRGPK
jgi:uncharacterized protein YecT (DUF1311 family)